MKIVSEIIQNSGVVKTCRRGVKHGYYCAKVKCHEFSTQSMVNEVRELLTSVEDPKIRKYIAKELRVYEHLVPARSNIRTLREIVNSVNSANGLYVVLDNGNRKNPILALSKAAKNSGHKLAKPETLANIALEEKFFPMKEFLKYNPKHELSDYLYEHYYLEYLKNNAFREYFHFNKKEITPAEKELVTSIIDKLRQISKTTGSKVFLDDCVIPQKITDAQEALKRIEWELEEWIRASKGKAKIPPVIDLMKSKKEFFFEKAEGFTARADRDTICIYGADRVIASPTVLRHEMTHVNETYIPAILNFMLVDSLRALLHPITKHVPKLRDSLLLHKYIEQAGKSDPTRYALTNHMEYIAVASEATNMANYPNWFRKILMAQGMPRFAFDLKPIPFKSPIEEFIAESFKNAKKVKLSDLAAKSLIN